MSRESLYLPDPLPDVLGASAALAFLATSPWWLLYAWLRWRHEETEA